MKVKGERKVKKEGGSRDSKIRENESDKNKEQKKSRQIQAGWREKRGQRREKIEEKNEKRGKTIEKRERTDREARI